MTFEVRNPEVEKKLKHIGQTLKGVMPKGYGFVLLIASHGAEGSMFYSSSLERKGVIELLKEFIALQEKDGSPESSNV